MTDTSKEAVESLVYDLKLEEWDYASQVVRALLSERDELRAQLQAARDEALEEAALMCDEAHKYHTGARDIQKARGNEIAAQDRSARMTTCRILGCQIRALKSASAKG